jgi:hypothetical protein
MVTVTGLAAFQAALHSTVKSDVSNLSAAGTSGPWLNSYVAQDAAGNAAPRVRRKLYIDTKCPSGETRCPSTGDCSVATLCISQLAAGLNPAAPPAVAEFEPAVDDTEPSQLHLAMLNGDQVEVRRLPGTMDTVTVVETTLLAGVKYADPGVTAVDDVDGRASASSACAA